MAKHRDSQRARLYRAERATFGGFNPEPAPGLENIEACQEFIDRITRSRWYRGKRWNLCCPGRMIRVTDGRSRRRGGASPHWGGGGELAMPRSTRQRFYLLHELAHLVQMNNSINGAPPHGREYMRVYLALVDRWLGHAEGKQFREALKQHGVRWRGKERAKAAR